MLLQVQQISKKYGNQLAVDNVSFSVKMGEIVGFLGLNGAGKSTTMKIITGCLAPNSGDVLIDNTSILENPLKTKKNVGYLPENNPLYEDMFVREYLEYVIRMYDSQKEYHERVEKIIKETFLSAEANKKIGQLSKGYKQRVGLAQAFIHHPKLLILDEPITGLDPNQIDEIEDFLKIQSMDKAILFSSHTLSEVASICTRVIIIHQGKIVLDKKIAEISDLAGTFKELTKNEINSR